MARPTKKAAAKKTTRQTWKPLQQYQHQVDATAAFKRGIRRMFLGWHRRAGKDVWGLDFARERMLERVGSYWHLFPFHVQAKRAIWKGIDARTGERFIDRAFPKSIRTSENDTDMSLSIDGGSSWQMLGSDNYDRMVGSNPCGVFFSEWALCDPQAWDYIRPILIENNGWAIFITTFRGRNHAYRMFENVRQLDDWYTDIRTIEDTYRLNGDPIVTLEDVESERRAGMSEALIQQEFYCNPDAAESGAIFNKQYKLLMQHDCIDEYSNSRVLNIAWGLKDEGITAIAYQGHHVMAVHTFVEQNIADAVQSVSIRHGGTAMLHHVVDPDTALFNALDGSGVVRVDVPTDLNMLHGCTATALNACTYSKAARERLADFAMSYAPYRERLDDYDLAQESIAQALAVMQRRVINKPWQPKRIDYSRYDRTII